MEEISVKGKTYLKAKVIARELGYTNDYIGQLCRAGKVDAELVGRTWYVDPDTVKGHKEMRYRSAKASTQRELRSHVAQSVAESSSARANFYTHRVLLRPRDIKYETDEAELLPQPKRLEAKPVSVTLPIELADAQKLEVEAHESHNYHFEAPKREETKFFGTLRVTDFISEVAVAGEDDGPQPVQVNRAKQGLAERPVSVEQSAYGLEPKSASKKSSVDDDSRTHDVAIHKGSVAIPVTVDNEEGSLPFVYHIVTAGAFVSALMLAAICIGLEANVIATKASVVTRYAFVADHLSALIYLIK